MSKQTAVEWLVEKYELVGMLTPPMIERAKAMEREQIINAALELVCNEYELEVATQDLIDSAEQYYNSTYKGGEQWMNLNIRP